jgi:hypothetical protein
LSRCTRLSDAERAFLTEFATATDRGSFIENDFIWHAVNEGKQVKAYTYRRPDVDLLGLDLDGVAGWVGLHRFFGMYVANYTQYGEGQDEYGPFATREDADDAFSAIVGFCIP